MSAITERCESICAAIESLRRYHGQEGRHQAHLFTELLAQLDEQATQQLTDMLNHPSGPSYPNER